MQDFVHQQYQDKGPKPANSIYQLGAWTLRVFLVTLSKNKQEAADPHPRDPKSRSLKGATIKVPFSSEGPKLGDLSSKP